MQHVFIRVYCSCLVCVLVFRCDYKSIGNIFGNNRASEMVGGQFDRMRYDTDNYRADLHRLQPRPCL